MPEPAIERVSASDLTTLVTDVGAAPMQVGAVLLLDGCPEFDTAQLERTIGARLGSIPRLRQRLLTVPFGCGRPIWVDDRDFDLSRHLTTVHCPRPRDRDAVLALAAELVTTRLDRNRPLWSATLVTGLPSGAGAIVVVFHHVLADGIGGLAMLADLVDGTGGPVRAPAPLRPAPSTMALALDAARSRLAALLRLPATLRRVPGALASIRPRSAPHAAPCSLNRPTGARRQLAHVSVPLQPVIDAGHAQGATVNDVLLAAITAAMADVLRGRDESVERFVVSIPVSHRQATTVAELGNSVSAVPVELPGLGDPADRLRRIADITREAKRASIVGSADLVLGPVFRLLARVRLFGWFIDRQRMVHTFVTNLRGPSEHLHLGGTTVTEVLPVAVVPGNVTVSFAVLSYAGTIGVTIVADPDACVDRAVLEAALGRRLAELAPSGSDPTMPDATGQR